MLSAVAAMSKNRVIGKNGKLPWKIKEDLAKFKEITIHHRVIMGRKTFDSLSNPLIKRENIVLSKKNKLPLSKNLYQISSKEDLLTYLEKQPKDKENFVIGGEEIFSLFLSNINKIYLSFIPENFEGDTFFPIFENDFLLKSEEKFSANYKFSFQRWERKS